MKEENSKEIPIFFAVDDTYIPFLGVALQSLLDNSSKNYKYLAKILYTKISNENMEKINNFKTKYKQLDIEFVDVNSYLHQIEDKLYTRDYFSKSTYFRLFIPDLYPQYKKALYLDSDITVLSDISKLYNTKLGTNLLAAAPDDVIDTIPVFQEYAEKVVGVADYKNYFNAGILVMNLDELRKFRFQEKFLYLLKTTKFSVAQDQDYLNRLCKGRVTLLSKSWNKMPVSGDSIPRNKINLIHYNLAFKPWHFDGVLYEEYFWKYAKKTEFYKQILSIKENYPKESIEKDSEGDKKLRELAQMECDCVGDDRYYVIKKTELEEHKAASVINNNETFDEDSDFDDEFDGILAYDG